MVPGEDSESGGALLGVSVPSCQLAALDRFRVRSHVTVQQQQQQQ